MNRIDEDRPHLRRATATAIQLAVLAAWVVLCARFIAPFFFLVVWGAVLATAVWPLVRRIAPGRPKVGAAVFVVVALTLILLPSWILLEAVVTSIVNTGKQIAHGDFKLPPPNEHVLAWPLVGKRLFDGWTHAVETPSAVIEQFIPQLRAAGRWLMESAGHLLSGILQSALAVILAGLFLANAAACQRAMILVAEKLLPSRGANFIALSGATVRSVAQGVIGIACLQAILAAIGLFLVGVPAAGVWSALVLMLAVMQLPPLLVLGPITAYLFMSSSYGTSSAVAFLIWSVVVSASDGFLKPFVLGRGVGVPSLVILIGAIGGMITDGIVGLFVGAVVLAVGYKLAEAWVADDNDNEHPLAAPAPSASQEEPAERPSSDLRPTLETIPSPVGKSLAAFCPRSTGLPPTIGSGSRSTCWPVSPRRPSSFPRPWRTPPSRGCRCKSVCIPR
jgi:predicted PurR-regulated permease PerM